MSKMRTVILDGGMIANGNLSWEAFTRFGPTAIYDRTAVSQILERAKDAEAIITVRVPIGEDVIKALPNLKYIGVMATGTDLIDSDAANRRGIVITNVPSYSAISTAQGAMALLLELTNHVGRHNQGVHEGKWSRSKNFCYWDAPIIELSDLTLGLVGFGEIAQRFAKLALAHDMRVIVATKSGGVRHTNLPVYFCELSEIFRKSDVVSLHCPLNTQTEKMINEQSLSRFKDGAYLINTARGGLVDEFSLASALKKGHLAGAGIDVMECEPPALNNPLLGLSNCIITPHNNWSTQKTRGRLLSIAAENLSCYFSGKSKNVVNFPCTKQEYISGNVVPIDLYCSNI